MRWKIFYGDGSTFSSGDGTPDDAPALNVQCIVQVDEEVGRYILSRRDYYWYEGDTWYGGDIFGLFDFLIRRSLVKFGRMIGDEEFKGFLRIAAEDSDFPRKSAWKRDER